MNISGYIDHTNLNRSATKEEIEKLCEEAKEYHFASVCVHPYYVSLCSKLLKDSDVAVCTVIGFPLGENTTEVKVFEAEDAINKGAVEIDMVINVSALKNEDYYYVEEEIRKIREVCNGITLKVIIEECCLTEEEIVRITHICNECGVDYIKTSTGFDKHGATMEAVHIIKANKKDNIGIKASGGIRDYETAKKFIDAGATRIGTSSGIKIMEGEE